MIINFVTKLYKSNKIALFVFTVLIFTTFLNVPMPAQAAATCGLSDSLAHKPGTVSVPAKGGSFVDPVYGCKITRLSDASSEGQSRVTHQYSSVNPFNADSTLVILEHDGGYMDVRDLSGNIVTSKLSIAGINPSANPVWSRTDRNLIYYHVTLGNVIKSYNIATQEVKTLHTFGEYSQISFGSGEGDISWDGDHLPILADNNPPAGEAGKWGFVYRISTDTFSAPVDLSQYAGRVDNADVLPSNSFASMHISPSGVELFDASGSHTGRVLYEAHADRGRDTNGSDVYVATNSADSTPVENCQNGIVKAILPGGLEKCLLPLDWSMAVHVSCNNYSQGWCLVSTYSASTPSAGNWPAYVHELLKVNLDGSGTTRLAHTRTSIPTWEYTAQPRAAVSGNGKYVLFDSNMGGRVDTYLLEIGEAPASPLPGLSPAEYGGTLPSSGESNNEQSSPPPQGEGNTMQGSATLDGDEWALLALINEYRAQNNLPAYQVSQTLTNSADWMSADMAAKSYMSHTDSLGRTVKARITAFGYGYNTWYGENIVSGSTAQAAFDWWKNACDPNSAGTCTYAHRKNMLHANYKVIGIGKVGSRWTTDFGAVVDAIIGPPAPAAEPVQSNTPHSPGSLVLHSGTVWRINDDGRGRQGIESLVKFQSHRFSFAKVVSANTADMALPDTGLLSFGHGVLFNHNGTIYQIAGTKHGFTSAAAFLGLGFSFDNVIKADLTAVPGGSLITSPTARHYEGTFVLDSTRTVWLMTATGRKGISSPQALFSLGGSFRDIVPANSQDMSLPAEGIIE